MSKPVGRWMWAMKRRGSFVNVSSIAHLHKGMLPGGFRYGTSKLGLIYLTKVMMCFSSVWDFVVSCNDLLSYIDF